MIVNDIEKRYLDITGYNQIVKEIEMCKQDLFKLGKSKSGLQKAVGGEVNGDYVEFDSIRREEERLRNEINYKTMILNNAIMVASEKNDSKVNVGDIVGLTIKYAEDDIVKGYYKLVSVCPPKSDQEFVTLSGPIGKAIHGQEVGITTSCVVNNKIAYIAIEEKVNNIGNKTKVKSR